jgi:hypothetical protein
MKGMNKGFNKLTPYAGAVLSDAIPGVKFDTLAAYQTTGIVCVTLSDSSNDNRGGETFYMDKAEALAFAAHLKSIAELI